MGKQIKWRCSKRHHSRKTPSAKIESYVDRLKRRDDLSTSSYLILVHNFIKRCLRTRQQKKQRFDPYRFVRVCKRCLNWRNKSPLVECFQCEDVYHEDCKDNQPQSDEEDWICGACERHCRKKLRAEVNRKSNLLPETHECCRACRREIPTPQLTKCAYCQQPYHTKKCFEKVAKGLVCTSCHDIIQEIAKQECNRLVEMGYLDELDEPQSKPLLKKSTCTSSSSNSSEEKEELLVTYSPVIGLQPTPNTPAKQKRRCLLSLLYAITSRRMRYVQELKYLQNLNNTLLSIDLELETINRQDLPAFREYKQNPIGPYEVVPTEGLGYDVKATRSIQKGTIVCEYVGEVISKRTAINRDISNDSLMELFVTNDADTSLLIKPESYTNIARFINGINNSDPEARKRVNLQSVRLNIQDQPRVLLYAKKNIECGESLLYDYNAGGKELFPTDDFL